MTSLNLIKKYKLQPPFFIYKKSIIEKQFLKLKNNLPKNFEIFYSIKANPNIHVLKTLKKLNANAEISSGGELSSALKAGFVSNKIIFTGPGKTNEELKKAIKAKINLIIVESLNEIRRIEKIACKLKLKQNILLRINPSSYIKQSKAEMLNLPGISQKLGVDEEYIPKIIDSLKKMKNVNLVGLHLFTTSNIFDEKIIINNTKHLFEVVKKIEAEFSINLPVINIGGGLGIGHSDNSKRLNLEKLSLGLSGLIDKYNFNDKRFVLETGRFLVGESGEYIAKVIDSKASYGEKFLIIDGGKNHLSLASLLKEGHFVEVLNKRRKGKKEFFNIVGNLNTPNDFISKTTLPGDVKIGDLISVKNTGAYSFSISWLLFSSRPIPKEYFLVKKGHLRDISKKIVVND